MKAKEHTSSFFVSEEFLAQLEELTQMLNVSKSIIIERSIYGASTGNFLAAERKIKPKIPKKKKKIPYAAMQHKKAKKRRKRNKNEQKCVYASLF